MRVLGFIPRIRPAYPCLSVDAGAKQGVGARTKCGHDAAVVAVPGRALLSRALREAPSLGPIMMP
jgi:hypothetical protein